MVPIQAVKDSGKTLTVAKTFRVPRSMLKDKINGRRQSGQRKNSVYKATGTSTGKQAFLHGRSWISIYTQNRCGVKLIYTPKSYIVVDYFKKDCLLPSINLIRQRMIGFC